MGCAPNPSHCSTTREEGSTLGSLTLPQVMRLLQVCQLVKGLAWLLWDILKIILHLCHMIFIHFHAGKWLENPCLGWEYRPEEAL